MILNRVGSGLLAATCAFLPLEASAQGGFWSGVITDGTGSVSITVEDPTGSEDISIAFTNRAITVTEMRAVLESAGSVSWRVVHGTDRSAAGNRVVTAGTATSSTTTGSDVTSFDDATIAADSFIWLETTSMSGNPAGFHLTIWYTVD